MSCLDLFSNLGVSYGLWRDDVTGCDSGVIGRMCGQISCHGRTCVFVCMWNRICVCFR